MGPYSYKNIKMEFDCNISISGVDQNKIVNKKIVRVNIRKSLKITKKRT
jgi:hypothetical protein